MESLISLSSTGTDDNFEIAYSDSLEGKILESIQKSDSLVIANYDYENQKAVTIPTQFSYSFGDGSSITTYIELQTINNKYNRDEELVGYTNKSFSLSNSNAL